MKTKTKELFKKHSMNRLSYLTGYSSHILREFRKGNIPNHITGKEGKYIPARDILERNILERTK